MSGTNVEMVFEVSQQLRLGINCHKVLQDIKRGSTKVGTARNDPERRALELGRMRPDMARANRRYEMLRFVQCEWLLNRN